VFEIPQPSMALNSHNVPPPDFRMWNTRKVTSDVPPSDLMSNIASVADSAKDNYLRCVVFNSHGSAGYLAIGTGIQKHDAHVFSALTGKVRTIVITACDVGAIVSPWEDGNLFCCAIAKSAATYVFASTALQVPGGFYTRFGLPVNMIDEFEGDVFRWSPDGSCRQVDNGYVQRWMQHMKMGLTPQDWK